MVDLRRSQNLLVKRNISCKINQNSSYEIETNENNLLPWKYRKIFELFLCLDNVVNLLIYKRENLYISKISSQAKNYFMKSITEENYLQILFVAKDCYYHRIIEDDTSKEIELIPNYHFGMASNFKPRKNAKSFTSEQLKSRKLEFFTQLFNLVKKKHEQFLVENNKSSNITHIRRWNPEFDVEQACDDITPVKLSYNTVYPVNNTYKTSLNVEISYNSIKYDKEDKSNSKNDVDLEKSILNNLEEAENKIDDLKSKNLVETSINKKVLTESNKIDIHNNSKDLFSSYLGINEKKLKNDNKENGELPDSLIKVNNNISNLKVTKENDRKSINSLIQTKLRYDPNKSQKDTLENNQSLSNNIPKNQLTEKEILQRLPWHLKKLANKFTLMDISMANKTKSYFNTLSKAMSQLSFEDIGRFLRIYPSAYHIKWEIKRPDINQSIKCANEYDLKIELNLINDGTESANRSNLNNSTILKFGSQQISERKMIFLNNCLQIVIDSSKKFEDKQASSETCCEQIFNKELHVPLIKPIDLPPKPICINKPPSKHSSKANTMIFPSIKQSPDLFSKSQLQRNLSVLDKIKIRNAHTPLFSKQNPKTTKLNKLSGLLVEINACLSSFKLIHRNNFIEELVSSTQLNLREVDELIELAQNIIPDWIESKAGMMKFGKQYSISQLEDRIEEAIVNVN